MGLVIPARYVIRSLGKLCHNIETTYRSHNRAPHVTSASTNIIFDIHRFCFRSIYRNTMSAAHLTNIPLVERDITEPPPPYELDPPTYKIREDPVSRPALPIIRQASGPAHSPTSTSASTYDPPANLIVEVATIQSKAERARKHFKRMLGACGRGIWYVAQGIFVVLGGILVVVGAFLYTAGSAVIQSLVWLGSLIAAPFILLYCCACGGFD